MKLAKFAALMSVLALTGCAYLPVGSPQRLQSEAPQNNPNRVATASDRPQMVYKKGPGFVDPKTQPYSVMGKTYWPVQSGLGYNEVGTASWYGIDFHGKKTATGEVYDMFSVSAAHKTLPLGTKVRVTNLENGRELELTVNDRGPFVDGRIIDLSYASARLLGMADNGVAKVRVEGVSDNPAIATATVKTTTVASNDMPLRRPKQQIIERNIVEEPAARPQPLQAQAQPRAEHLPAKATVSSSQTPASTAPRAEPKAEVMAKAQAGKYAVQVGAFAQDDNARRVQAALVQSGYSNARITRVVRDGRDLHVVQAGSFAEREQAEEALRSLKAQFPASFINSGA